MQSSHHFKKTSLLAFAEPSFYLKKMKYLISVMLSSWIVFFIVSFDIT